MNGIWQSQVTGNHSIPWVDGLGALKPRWKWWWPKFGPFSRRSVFFFFSFYRWLLGFWKFESFPRSYHFPDFCWGPYFCSTCGCWDHSFGHVWILPINYKKVAEVLRPSDFLPNISRCVWWIWGQIHEDNLPPSNSHKWRFLAWDLQQNIVFVMTRGYEGNAPPGFFGG